jgi:hypothetical protein
MKSITIHNIEEPLEKEIKSKAKAEGLSVNKTIKKILEQAFGVEPKDTRKNRRQFEEFCGVWSKSDLKEFEKATREFREVDPEEWE